jgi:hypothetical protein
MPYRTTREIPRPEETMEIDRELLNKARRNPSDLRFEDALKLARQLGFDTPRVRGSHHVMTHPKGAMVRGVYPRPLNLQKRGDGKAKAYEIRQMLQMAEAMGIIASEER